MKINWRDASKELPKKQGTLIVLVGSTLEVHENFYSLDLRAFLTIQKKQ